MEKSVSHAVSTRVTNIILKAGDPRADIGRRLIEHMIRILTCIVHFMIFPLENSWITIFHSVICCSIISGFDLNWVGFFIITYFYSSSIWYCFFYVAHPFIIKMFQLYLWQEQVYKYFQITLALSVPDQVIPETRCVH